MNGKQLKNSLLQWAIQGKLVTQEPNDEPASVLLERIRQEKMRLVKEKKIKKEKDESIIYRGEDNSYYEEILATGEVKCIDEEILFEIPGNWVWCRMGDILNVKGGKRIPLGRTFAKVPTTHIYIRITDMKNGTIVDSNLKYIDEDVYAEIYKYTISKEDLYLTIAGTIGAIGIVPPEFDEMNLTENAVKLSDIGINKDYLIYMVNSEFIQTQFRNLTNQMAQPKLSIRSILSTLIAIPPLSEQHRIVAKIEELMPYVEKYGKAQEKLDNLNGKIKEALRKSILQEAIQGRLVPQMAEEGSGEELLAQIRQEKERLVKEKRLSKSVLADSDIFKGDDGRYYEQVGETITCIDEQIPFEIPESWVWTKLETIASLYTGNSISESEKISKYTNVKGLEYIGTKDVEFDHTINYENGIAIPDKYIDLFKIAPAQSILLCVEGGSAGKKITQVDRNVCFGNKLCCIVPYEITLSKYIYYYMQAPSFLEIFKGNISGIIGGVSLNTLKTILMPLPSFSEQRRIVAKIEELLSLLTPVS
ncbi:MAG: restriction endonuclease subunit S [Porphyromonadaceae bacterium]|nr:restriction endonuclease subunit S [Porphyromonadaceae bacterium]